VAFDRLAVDWINANPAKLKAYADRIREICSFGNLKNFPNAVASAHDPVMSEFG
jgi:hypothetical protein